MDVHSGSEKHQFRRLHQVLIQAEESNTAVCARAPEFYADLEPVRRRFCSLPPLSLRMYDRNYGMPASGVVKSGSLRYIFLKRDVSVDSCVLIMIFQVLDEAAKLPNEKQQLEFIEANKQYMSECTMVYGHGLIRVGGYFVLCSYFMTTITTLRCRLGLRDRCISALLSVIAISDRHSSQCWILQNALCENFSLRPIPLCSTFKAGLLIQRKNRFDCRESSG